MENEKLIIFNVNQQNVARCLDFNETAIRQKKVPKGVSIGSRCLLRQTSRGDGKYGVLGVYRVAEIESIDPKEAIRGWTPSTSWTYKIHLTGQRLPKLFEEKFCINTQWLKIKESSKVKGLMNKDIQGESRLLNPKTSTNYLLAIEDEMNIKIP